MNSTQKNILRDVLYNIDGLREGMGTLLEEEKRRAGRKRCLGSRAGCEETLRACRCLEEAMRHLDGAMESAREAIGSGWGAAAS